MTNQLAMQLQSRPYLRQFDTTTDVGTTKSRPAHCDPEPNARYTAIASCALTTKNVIAYQSSAADHQLFHVFIGGMRNRRMVPPESPIRTQ